MPEITILLAENNEIELDYRTKLLAKNNYTVLQARTGDEARDHLGSDREINLAILDIRMTPGEPDEDEYGLYLAHETTMANIPTIILTSWPKYEFVRRAQSWFPNGTPTHINFVDKEETNETFLRVVKNSIRGRNVFIVHGRAKNARNAVELFIRQVELDPFILQDQPNRGRTIIEKLENHPNLAYIVVLITPDDIGRYRDESEDEAKAQARQNVIFELGYFMGKYGRHKVSILLENNAATPPIELPTDIAGFTYISMRDDNQWQAELVKELRFIGLHVKYP